MTAATMRAVLVLAFLGSVGLLAVAVRALWEDASTVRPDREADR